MKSFFVALAVLLAVVIAAPAADACTKHPMKDHVLQGFTLVNKGLSCFFEEDSGCFSSFKNQLSTYYSATPTAVKAGAENLCGQLTHHCLLESEIDAVKAKYDEFVTTYRNILNDLFAYKVTEDKTIDDILKKIADAIKGISDLIPADVIDKLIPQAKDAVVGVFEDLKVQVQKLSEHYEPFLNAVEEYNAGQFCFSALADYEKFVDANTGGVRVSTDAFEAIAATFSSFKMEQIDGVIAEIRAKLLTLWDSIAQTGNNFIDGVINNLLPFEDYLKEDFVTDKLFFVGGVEEFTECFFPSDPNQAACVPFVDDVLAFIERLKKLFNGDFAGFMDSNKIQLASIEDQDLLEMRQRLIATQSASDARPIMWVPGTADNVYSFLKASNQAPSDLQPTSPSGPNSSNNAKKIFGFDALYVYAAAGALVALIWISCLVACCNKQQKPVMMAGGMGYTSIPNSMPMTSMNGMGAQGQPMYM